MKLISQLNVDKIAERLGEEPEAVIRKVDRYRESDPTLKVNLVSSHKNVKLLKPDENGRLAKFDQAKADKAAAKMAKEKAKIAEKLAKKKAKAAEKKSNTDPNELITLRVVVVKKEPEDDNVAATTTEANERPRKKVRYIAEYNERDYLEGAAEEMGRWIAECAEKKWLHGADDIQDDKWFVPI